MNSKKISTDSTGTSLAVISVIFGALSLLIFAHLFGATAIVCGVIAGVRGKRYAWIGVVLGVLAVVSWAFQMIQLMNELDLPSS